jgi:hypothetical protein
MCAAQNLAGRRGHPRRRRLPRWGPRARGRAAGARAFSDERGPRASRRRGPRRGGAGSGGLGAGSQCTVAGRRQGELSWGPWCGALGRPPRGAAAPRAARVVSGRAAACGGGGRCEGSGACLPARVARRGGSGWANIANWRREGAGARGPPPRVAPRRAVTQRGRGPGAALRWGAAGPWAPPPRAAREGAAPLWRRRPRPGAGAAGSSVQQRDDEREATGLRGRGGWEGAASCGIG